MEQIRTFIAIELSEGLKAGLVQVQEQLKAEGSGRTVRWVRPEGIHLTLKFLGNVPADRIEQVKQAVARACVGFAPLEVEVTGLGCFPNLRRPNVVWVGVEEKTGTLARLQAAVDEALSPLGYPPEKRGFTPHLTLGRVRREASKNERQALGDIVQKAAVSEVEHMRAESVNVMKSNLKPTGAEYTCLAAVKLEGKAERS